MRWHPLGTGLISLQGVKRENDSGGALLLLARGSPSPRQEFVAAIVRPEFDEADENIGRIGLWRPLCWLCCRLSAKTDGRMGCDHDAYISSDQRVVSCCFIGNPDAGIGTAPAKPASFLLRSGSVRISRPFARPIPTATSPPICRGCYRDGDHHEAINAQAVKSRLPLKRLGRFSRTTL